MNITEILTEWLANPIFHRWRDGLWDNTLITLYMTFGCMFLTVLLGTPLGVFLFEAAGSRSRLVRAVHSVTGFVVNVVRSFPFIILIIALIPFTRELIGRSTGPNAAMLALVVSAVPFFARLVEVNLRDIPHGKIEAALMMGASRWQIVRQVLIPEALPGLIGSITTTTIAVVGYTAMAGTVGGKGLGDLAFRLGYGGYDNGVTVAAVIMLLIIVIAIQMLGDRMSRAVDHRAGGK
ncbi:methionine ABC transporter permease [Dermabacteraceae bacterium P13101]